MTERSAGGSPHVLMTSQNSSIVLRTSALGVEIPDIVVWADTR